MTRTLRVFGLAAALVLPGTLLAQGSSDRSFSLGVSGGLAMPIGDMGDSFDSGFDVTGHIYLRPAALKSIGLRGDVGFDKFSAKDVSDVTFRSLSFVANAIVDLSSSSSAKPYLLGGVGLYNGKAEVKSSFGSGSSSDSNLGIQAGGGLQFQLSGFSTFLEARYVNVFSDGSSTQWIPITFGVKF